MKKLKRKKVVRKCGFCKGKGTIKVQTVLSYSGEKIKFGKATTRKCVFCKGEI